MIPAPKPWEVRNNQYAGARFGVEERPRETTEEIEKRLAERFSILEILANACVCGDARSLIVSGPAGLGKSYTVEKQLSKWDPNAINHTIIKGYVRATGLLKMLYRYRENGKVVVFDDADAIFFDDTSLSLLKAVCDTTEKRKVHWLSEGTLIDEETAERIPRAFDFDGAIIFITNYDFDAMIDRGHKLKPHFEALVSRSHYVDLSMRTRRDYLVRIRQVVCDGLISFLPPDQQVEVCEYIEINHPKLRELSLRMALKIAHIRKTNSGNWKNIANITCCRY